MLWNCLSKWQDKLTTMHGIRTSFCKFYGIGKELFKNETGNKKNFRFYPVPPKMNDLEVVSLACCMEALSIDSEHLLWNKLKKDYASVFPNLMDRSRFSRRRKRLLPFILKVQDHDIIKAWKPKPDNDCRQCSGACCKDGKRKKFQSIQKILWNRTS